MSRECCVCESPHAMAEGGREEKTSGGPSSFLNFRNYTQVSASITSMYVRTGLGHLGLGPLRVNSKPIEC